MRREAFLEAVLAAIHARLSALEPGWQRVGEELRGPGPATVRLAERHVGGPNHVDVAFERGPLVLWDCIAFPDPAVVAHIWASTLAPVGLELGRRDGTFADHDAGAQGIGMPGWHSVAGPVIAYGPEPAEPLRDWLLHAQPVAALAHLLGPSLAPDRMHGIKVLLLGGLHPTAELRVDGEVHSEASEVLRAMSWPHDVPGVARQHFALLHPA